MQQSIHNFQNLLKTKRIDISNKYLKEILYKFDFIFYQDILQAEEKIKQNENKSKIIIIDECMENGTKYYVICFDFTLIIIPQEDKTDDLILPSILTRFKDNDKYYIRNCNIQTGYDTDNNNFFKEIRIFSKKFIISNKNMQHFWSSVVNCLSGFLIKKGYQNSRNRHEKYLNEKFIEYQEENANFVNKSYIELRNIGYGSCGTVDLIYHIPKEEIFALKIPYAESQHLIERERSNYLNIRHPFIVQYIGYIKFANDPKYLLLEYVEGETLDEYDLSHLNDQEKYTIILELLLSIHYLHSHNYIYRDLRLNNIMINQNNDAILIDFDRVLKENDEKDNEEQTINFDSPSVAPEENKTYKSDIYSLGYIIHFILYGIPPIINYKLSVQGNFKFKSCFETDPTKRPNINEMTNIFYTNLYSKIKFGDKKFSYLISLSSNQNIPEAQFDLGNIYYEGLDARQDINKAIHYFSLAANQNHPQAQLNLGIIYHEGKYVARDINKAIHYYSLAANQNDPQAQFNLGRIYSDGEYVTRDINKAIHYFSLAANQNHLQAQYNLGIIYHEGKYVARDINKAIHYYSLAANQNDPQAQFNLGRIYSDGKYVARDINKAIHYFSLAANQNDPQAQFNLGRIYSDGEYVTRDINKAIHYFSLAANQNDPQAQLNLGIIHHEGKYVARDINKAIHYFSLAANQNDPQAQYNLGIIYYEGKYVARDINKAIHYYSLAANQNDPQAQFNLGRIYSDGEYVARDINKAIHYYSLAANQNDPQAQFNLGRIYSDGEYVTRDINKAIHYYSLAANQNDPQAQYNLGLIYSNGECITRDTSNDTLKKNQIDTNVIFEIKQFEEECTSQSKEFEIQLQNEINKLQEIQKEMAKNREKQNEKLTQIQMMLETNQKSSHISEEFDIKSDEVIEFKLGSKNIKTMKIQILNQNFHQLFALYEKNQNLNHPNILKSNGFLFDDEKSPSIILFEFCPINLEQGIKKKMLSKVKLMYSIYQILETMKYLHSKQVTHINLNPSNIFINKDGLIKICMFDISPPMSTDDHKNLNDKESDIYSFGVLIYFLLSGGEFPWSNTPVTFSSIAQKMINECLGSANKMSFDVISSILMIENYNLISLSQQKIHEISEIVNKYKSQNPVSNNS